MRRASLWGAALLLLAACSSTAPGATQSTTGSPAAAGASTNPAAASATAASTTEQTDGPVTPTMARLLIGGERHAAMGDPDAPLTIVEYSDYG